jgi:hypothetical protein
MRRFGFGIALAVLGLAGCSEYKYFDVTVKLDPATLGNGINSSIQRCNTTVTNAKGGIEDDFLITDPRTPDSNTCPLGPGRTEGTFEYSTKDSGSLTFTITVYDSMMTTSNCEIGRGQATVSGDETTNSGDVVVMGNGQPGCT